MANKQNATSANKARAKALVGRNEEAAAARAATAYSGGWGTHDSRPSRLRTRQATKGHSVADSRDQ